eukprot:CAMPEP_0115183618 /NCGR_PEP_ID=MMETSP0270-20121206/8544_1 /TAXON_ID=71861 /ORGANISM="Scrippsiella trochoidea, Strain CCMP3099" /LENGTH=946 /DNA_ID=CAMNT_0002596687 /DNA_START=101 /DNA_END=2938 /DNA_ORIENTATION=-
MWEGVQCSSPCGCAATHPSQSSGLSSVLEQFGGPGLLPPQQQFGGIPTGEPCPSMWPHTQHMGGQPWASPPPAPPQHPPLQPPQQGMYQNPQLCPPHQCPHALQYPLQQRAPFHDSQNLAHMPGCKGGGRGGNRKPHWQDPQGPFPKQSPACQPDWTSGNSFCSNYPQFGGMPNFPPHSAPEGCGNRAGDAYMDRLGQGQTPSSSSQMGCASRPLDSVSAHDASHIANLQPSNRDYGWSMQHSMAAAQHTPGQPPSPSTHGACGQDYQHNPFMRNQPVTGNAWWGTGYAAQAPGTGYASPGEAPRHANPSGSGKRGRRNAGQTRESNWQRRGPGNVTRDFRRPAQASFAQILRAAKARLRHVSVAEGAPPDRNRSTGGRSSQNRNSGTLSLQGPAGAGVSARWVVQEGLETRAQDPDMDGNCEPLQRLQDLREVYVRVESSAPPGCQITVNLNGESSILSSGCVRQRGMMVEEKRFAIAPLGSGEAHKSDAAAGAADLRGIGRGSDCSSASAGSPRAEECSQDGISGLEHSNLYSASSLQLGGSRLSAQPSTEAVTMAAAEVPITKPITSGRAECASFSAVIMLDTIEVQAKTTQELKEPELEVVEVLETSVVVRMGGLTGDRFELTVYASGAVESLGSAATLVQRGPVRSTESVHRIGQLESSQVYVAWVRVFCESQVMESRQKGFKTLPPRVKTIWDEADHVILDVSPTATTKEITRAWRQKSLQFHPDKETDPDKKDAAEEMMKRLNLAKQNMLRSAPLDDNAASPSAAHSAAPDIVPRRDPGSSSHGAQQRAPSSDSSSSSDDLWSSQDGEARFPAMPKSPKGAAAHVEGEPCEEDSLFDKDSLRCSLRVEAPKSPKLKVLTRGLTSFNLEASGLPLGGMVEVQSFMDGAWQAVTEMSNITSPCMRFTVDDLEENSSYRFRLRTLVELEPLRLLFAEFAADE